MTPGWPDFPRVTWWHRLWRRFWALPMLVALASLGLGLLLPAVEASADGTPGWVFQGGVDGARSVLGTIAGAMISVTGLVFSITMVVLQLASSQFSPRILQSFLESRVVQLTLGFFTGSFVYALTVLRAVRGGEEGQVPQLAVTVSYAYVIVAVAMFLAFIHHITTSVQVTQVMADVRRRAVATTRRMGAERPRTSWSPRPGTPNAGLINGDRCGYVTNLDSTRLTRVAGGRGGVVELDLSPGDHVVAGQPLGRMWGTGDLSDGDRDALLAAVGLAGEREIRTDTAFGLRQLLDIADRALSPGVNDPTTAVQAVNELHVVLTALAQSPDPSPYLVQDGTVAAVYRPQRYAAMVHEVVSELAHYGADAPRVLARLRAALERLHEVARPEHRAATASALDRLEPGDAAAARGGET